MFDIKKLAKGLVTIALLIGLGLLLNYLLNQSDFNQAWIDSKVKHHGSLGVLYFMLFATITTAIGLPRQIAAFLGGYAFGISIGSIIATFATTLGCVVSFYVARLVGRRFIEKKFAHKVKDVNRFLKQKTLIKTIIIRLLPVGSNLITNLVAGVTKVKGRWFFMGSFIGYLPQMIIFAIAGSGVEVVSAWKISLSLILFIISSLLSWHLYRQFKMDKQTRESLTYYE